MSFIKTTEQSSNYEHLEEMSVKELLTNINTEDKTVPFAVENALPQIAALVEQIIAKMKNDGRLFYIGAGTSGRLGVVDASECPPTFGVNFDTVIGIIAGGDSAIRKAVEFAEDNKEQAWEDLQKWNITKNDVVIGIAASGTTPYVIGGLQKCNENKILTGSISCNAESPLSKTANYPIDVIVYHKNSFHIIEHRLGQNQMESVTKQWNSLMKTSVNSLSDDWVKEILKN